MRYRVLALFSVISALPALGDAAVTVPLIIQETLYPGSVGGVTRTADPVTVGIPLPDSATGGVTDVSTLTLTGANVGQFRVLGRWPSGRIKWVLIDTQAAITAGLPNTSIALTDGGSGDFGGPILATDNGSTITVNTGSATFTIRKARFNLLDQVVVGGTTVVASGASQGLVITGPSPGQTTCGTCTTIYSSANDSNSMAVIEENGPAKAVIRAAGIHKDGGGNPYMAFSVRLYFYKGKSVVKVSSILRNADYGTSSSSATAYKGFQAYELRLSPSLSGGSTYLIGNHTSSPTAGTLASSESVYLYQGQSQLMKWQDWCGYGCVPYTADSGYRIVKNGTIVGSGSDTQYPQGWADLRDANGAGISVGVYQLAAYSPKSLEFNAGGSDVRIGIWARENSQAYYQPWPQWSTHDLYLNFHSTALASASDEFLKYQHYLVARAAIAHYNSTSVFPYPLLDPATEDNWYKSTGAAAVPAIGTDRFCCIQDLGTSSTNWPLSVFRFYAWHSGGGANQAEFRWANLLNFLTRGMTGRYLNAVHFYRFQADVAWPHSDGFDWRDKAGEIDGFGFPTALSANSSLAFRDWLDQEHGHWYGMTDYYFMTGDETAKEALLDGTKDYFLNPNTYQHGLSGGLWNTRAVGIQLMGAARFAQFLSAIGDSTNAATVLTNSTRTYDVQVKPELCVSGYPVGCSIGGATDNTAGAGWTSEGTSRTRGIHWGSNGNSESWCGSPHYYRISAAFQTGVLIQGLLEFRNAKGGTWQDYWNSLDLAYGMAQWATTEMYRDDGSGRWDVNGFRYYDALDVPSGCEPYYSSLAPQQTVSMIFLTKYLVEGTTNWATKFKINIQKDASALGVSTSDFGEYQIATIAKILSTPTATALTPITLTRFTDNGGGSYTITWTVPTGAQSYRIKWGPKTIVDWIGFDAGNNVFTGDPVRTVPWFAATNVPTLPVPASAGTSQSLTLATGTPGLTAGNFSVKAYVSQTGAAPPSTAGGGVSAPPPPPTNLRLVTTPLSTYPGTGSETAALPGPGVDIAWTLLRRTTGWPGYNGYLSLHYDAVSRQTLHYGVIAGSMSIYSSDLFSYEASTNTWTHMGGNGTISSTCPASTASWPGNRHPVSQMAIDTKRNFLWLFGGVCQGVNHTDMYYLSLNADPTTNSWHQVSIQNPPVANDSSAIVYDPDDDVLFLFGSDTAAQTRDNWVYCRTGENATPGVLTPKQLGAGCTKADDWSEVAVVGGVQPPGVAYSGMAYDSLTKKVIQFGGDTGGGIAQNQTWAYDIPTRTWTRKALNTLAPPVLNGLTYPAQPALAYNPLTHKILYHQIYDVGAPKDWQYDPVADTWTQLISTGGGPTTDLVMAYDAANNRLIGFNLSAPASGVPDVWQGVLK
jgi:hypothetical protein